MITGVIVADECVPATHLKRARWAALSFARSPRRSHKHYSQIKRLLRVGKWHWDLSQHCMERSLLPKGWAPLALQAWLTPRIARMQNGVVPSTLRSLRPHIVGQILHKLLPGGCCTAGGRCSCVFSSTLPRCTMLQQLCSAGSSQLSRGASLH